VEYALVAHWRASGALAASSPRPPGRPVSEIVAVSGSVSAGTALQIDWAEAHGFDVIGLEPFTALDESSWQAEIETGLGKARAALSRDRSPLVVTARGPHDPAISALREKLSASHLDPAQVNARIGAGLGQIVGSLARDTGMARGAVSGGDTSGFAMRALDVYALEAIAPLAPGSPLCRIFSPDPAIDGFEIALKGGQMGAPDFFGSVRAGRAIS